MQKKKSLKILFFTFFKIGLFTFGGGYAMIPLIQREIAEQRGWITEGELLDIIAIAESTPGPIAINTATFVGYKTAKKRGAFCATLGVVLPSFCIILGISFILKQFEQIKPVAYAFAGIRAGVLALVIKALLSMYRQCPKRPLSYVLILFSFILAALGFNILAIIVICALSGLSFHIFLQRRENL